MGNDHDDGKVGCPHGVSRRGFFTAVGAGALGAATLGRSQNPGEPPAGAAEPTKVTLRVNGRTHTVLAEPRWTRLGVGAVYASPKGAGAGRLWVVLLYGR